MYAIRSYYDGGYAPSVPILMVSAVAPVDANRAMPEASKVLNSFAFTIVVSFS